MFIYIYILIQYTLDQFLGQSLYYTSNQTVFFLFFSLQDNTDTLLTAHNAPACLFLLLLLSQTAALQPSRLAGAPLADVTVVAKSPLAARFAHRRAIFVVANFEENALPLEP